MLCSTENWMILMAGSEMITVVISFGYGASQWGKYLQVTLAIQSSIQFVIKEE
jgi:hypothetical protein